MSMSRAQGLAFVVQDCWVRLGLKNSVPAQVSLNSVIVVCSYLGGLTETSWRVERLKGILSKTMAEVIRQGRPLTSMGEKKVFGSSFGQRWTRPHKAR